MYLSLPFDGSSGPDCVVEHMIHRFRFSQADQALDVTSEQALALAAFLEELEGAAMAVAKEDTDLVVPAFEVPDLKMKLEPANADWGYSVRLSGPDGSVAFDLDAIWAVRVFMREAVRQETEGLYHGW